VRVGPTFAILGLIIAAPVPSRGASDAAPLGRVDYLPYQVSVSVAFSRDTEITETFRRTVCSTLRTRLEQTFGATWIFPPGADVVPNDRLVPPNESGLERLTHSVAAEQFAGFACDKAYFLTVSRRGPKWFVSGREWDGTLRSLGPPASETTTDRGSVADAALAVITRIFSPLLIVDDADRDSKSAVLTIRAGSIPYGDPKFQPLKAGDILQPVFRFLDSKHAVRSIQSVPWTYLVLGPDPKNGRSQVRASVVSSYRAPLAANMRRRVEAIAVRVRPEFPATRLTLVAGKDPPQPQAGLFVTVSELAPGTAGGKSSARPAADSPRPAEAAGSRLLSDRYGEVTIPVDPQQPIVRLEVHSGGAILARRPFMPGLEPDVTLQVADDRVRLGAEREVDILESQLIETVARRGALMARTRAAIKRTDVSSAQKLLAEVDRLPPADEYLGQLNKIRVLALEEAHNRKDRVSERRIEDLCQKTLDRITQYLSDDRVATFKEEVAQLLNAKKVETQQLQAPMHRDENAAPREASAQPAANAPLRRRSPDELKPPAKKEPANRPTGAAGI